MRIRELLGVGALGSLLSVAEANNVEVESMREVQPVYDNNFKDKIKDGFSVVLFYSSNPPEERKEDMKLTQNMYLGLINQMKGPDFMRLDTQNLRANIGDDINNYMRTNFGFSGSPTLVAYCNGEQVYLFEGCNPRNPETVTPIIDLFYQKLTPLESNCK